MTLKVFEMSSNHTLVSLCLGGTILTRPKKGFVNLRKSHYLSSIQNEK